MKCPTAQILKLFYLTLPRWSYPFFWFKNYLGAYGSPIHISSPEFSTELQVNISNWLLHVFIWNFVLSLKLNMFKMESLTYLHLLQNFSSCVLSNLSSWQLQSSESFDYSYTKLGVALDWSLSAHLIYNSPKNFVYNFKIYPDIQIHHIFPRPIATTDLSYCQL